MAMEGQLRLERRQGLLESEGRRAGRGGEEAKRATKDAKAEEEFGEAV